MNCKFKVGDKVKVTNSDKHAWKRKYIGNIYTINRINPNGAVMFGEPHYGVAEPCMYVFLESELELVDASTIINRVIFNDPATVIIWNDGTKTVAKAVKGDKYDPEKGFAIAYAKKFGGKTFREEMEKWCESIKPVAEVTLGGFKVGDRVSYEGHMGTVVCIKEGSLGVKMDEREIGLHDCGGFKLIAGDYPDGMCSRWLAPSMIKHVDENEPLTMEELKKMDGKKVWLSSLFDGEEIFNDIFCGWHVVNVRENRLDGVDGSFGYYDITDMNDPYGFRAHLTQQTGKKN